MLLIKNKLLATFLGLTLKKLIPTGLHQREQDGLMLVGMSGTVFQGFLAVRGDIAEALCAKQSHDK